MDAPEMALRAFVILNVGSGSHDKGALGRQISSLFAAASMDAVLTFVPGSEVEEAACRGVSDGYTTIVAAGGDGTVSTVASVVAGSGRMLGVLPLGTLNHFAKDAGIPLGLADAVKTIAAGRARNVDMGEVNGRLFLNNSSLGLYPRLVWQREEERRSGRSKWPAFGRAVVRIWREYRTVRVLLRSDDHERAVRTPFVFVGNNEYGLHGLRFGARRRLDEGRLQVCMAPGLRRIDVAPVLLKVLVGRVDSDERFESLAVTEFSVEARRPRLSVSLDGEVVMIDTPLRYRTRPNMLEVCAPAEAGGRPDG